MKLVAETDYYRCEIDRSKNRMYLIYKGLWANMKQVPDFVRHHAETVNQLSPGFTVLADVRQMEGVVISDIIEECQRYAIKAGIRKAARVYAKPTFMEVQAERMHERSGMLSRSFYSVEEAEAWLDET